MNELIVALGLFFFIEGILYAIFPTKMKNMLKKIETVKDSQLRDGWTNFCNYRIYNYLLYKRLI